MDEEERATVRAGKKAKELMESEAWQFHAALLDVSIRSHLELLASPSAGLDGLIHSEYAKGTLNGLRLSRGLLEATVEASEMILKKWHARGYREEAEEEDDAQHSVEVPSGSP